MAITVDQLRVGMSTGGNTTGTTAMVGGQVMLAAVGELALSQSVSGGSATVSIYEPNSYKSYFEYIPVFNASSSFTLGGSSIFVQPFILPYDVSVSYMRFPTLFAFGSSTTGTTANSNWTLRQTDTVWVNIYSLGVGASSRSLQYINQASATIVLQVAGSIGAASNNQTVSHNITYPAEGAANNNFATNYNVNSGSINFSTTHLTAFNSVRMLDIPYATTLGAGTYWMGIARSSATATTGGAAVMTALTMRHSMLGVTQISANPNLLGGNTTAGSNAWQLGHGYWTTNTNGKTSSSMALSHVSTFANLQKVPFQFIRQA